MSALLIVLGILGLIHHYCLTGLWFQVEDIHHETLILVCFGLSLGIIIGRRGR